MLAASRREGDLLFADVPGGLGLAPAQEGHRAGGAILVGPTEVRAGGRLEWKRPELVPVGPFGRLGRERRRVDLPGGGEDPAGDGEDLGVLHQSRLHVALVVPAPEHLDVDAHRAGQDRTGDVPGEGPQPARGLTDLQLHRPGEDAVDQPAERPTALLPAVGNQGLELARCGGANGAGLLEVEVQGKSPGGASTRSAMRFNPSRPSGDGNRSRIVPSADDHRLPLQLPGPEAIQVEAGEQLVAASRSPSRPPSARRPRVPS